MKIAPSSRLRRTSLTRHLPALALLASGLVAAPTAARAQEGASGSPVAAARASADAAIAAIVAIPDGERTIANTLRAMDDVVARFFIDTRMTTFMESVSPDEAERDLGSRASKETGEFYIEFEQDERLFRALRAFLETNPRLEGEDARLAERLERDFRRAGMGLPQEKRERLLAVEKELNELEIEFRKNIRDDDTTLLLLPEELAGIPDSFLDTLPRSGGVVIARMDGPLIRRIFDQCEVEGTRQKASIALGRRAEPNLEVLEKLIGLRHEKANLLGYPTTGHYETEIRMAHDPEAVMRFYDDLVPKLRRKALLDFEELQQAKREHTGDPAAVLKSWDVSFYTSYLRRERYEVDDEEVRQYFPLEAVTNGLFSITQKIYGLRYVEIDPARAVAAGRRMWHPDVHLYEVRDAASDELLGEFYVDLHPREGKYNHAAQFPLAMRKVWPDGSITRPLVALVCNFTKPTADRPALLSHDEVETYFHEFGHCLHSLLTEATCITFAGTQVARDFVEAPSQMFENWVWDAAVLQTFARRWDTREPFPAELLRGMLAARHLASGLTTEGQVFLGRMDMAFHSDPDGVVDTSAVKDEVYRETRLFEPVEGSWSQASFGHLVGYQAGYYGYLWSLVFAQDMASVFRDEGFLEPAAGLRYRKAILSRGGTVDELDMVRRYLGREPRTDAFLEHLGLTDGQ